ncbi:MAG: carbohydrate porin, partial [Gemmatimonadaceae bacterium]|nr:carbohydrate porin [Gloeobacterales cyanobacterium ES-bin-141]
RNKYTQNEGQNISFRNFRRDPLYVGIQTGNRPGGHIDLRFSNAFSLRAIYLAEDGGQAVGFGSGGIVGGSTQVAGELGIKPSPSIDIGLGYSYVNVSGSDTNFIFGNAGSDVTGGDGRLAYNPDLVSNISHSIFHGRLDWDIFPAFAIFGRYSFDTASLYGYSGGTPVGGSLDANTWMAGLALPDFLGKGNLLEAAYLQPINITNNGVVSTRVEQDAEGNNVRVQNEVFNPNISSTNLGVVYPRRSATESNIAVSYRFRVTDRLTVTPEVLFVLGANNINQNGITIGNLRATFEF